jgi:PPK2 family polyphosphate:nucleotide phosphotransferase
MIALSALSAESAISILVATMTNVLRWMVPPGSTVNLAGFNSADTGDFQEKEQAEAAMAADIKRLQDLQELFYVDGRHALLLILQGTDTAGKDGTVKHLSHGLGLVGAEMTNFKAPTTDELAHDFLWRIHQHVPACGRIGIFNRSHYEDVLIVRVHNLVPQAVWEARYDQINAFERILTQNNTVILKCFLQISKDEQKERLQARLDDPTKHWKFNPGDLKERARWHEYRAAYEAALSRCSTENAPWYVIPSDKKWFRNYAVTRLLIETLESLDLRLPTPSFDPKDVRIV